ncbi:MAG: uL15 family ribosomal protein [Candidatus Pacebacteria bacterium]|nr:uL15 family ribosomal protein [Candidatus Paceibacterota bacterium]
MQTHNLKRVHELITHYQVGRGGKRGKTSGRGGKGQTARAGNKRRPELRDLIKKLPKMRGRGKNSNKTIDFRKVFPINLELIEAGFNAGEIVSPKTLLEKGAVELVKGNLPLVKILSVGEITKHVTVEGCEISAGAKAKIEKAGGKAPALAIRLPKRAPVKVVVKEAPKAKAPKAPAKEKKDMAAPAKEKAPVKEKVSVKK